MMGHTQDISGGYLEKDAVFFKRVYVAVEPFLTVFTGADNETKKRNQDLERGIVNNTLEVQNLKGQVQDLKEQLKSATEIVYSFSDVLTIFSKIADTKEGTDLIKKIQEAKHKAEYQNKKEDAQISAINPLAEKPERMPTIKPIK